MATRKWKKIRSFESYKFLKEKTAIMLHKELEKLKPTQKKKRELIVRILQKPILPDLSEG